MSIIKHLYFLIFLVAVSCNQHSKKTTNVEKLYDYDVEEKLAGLGIVLSDATLPAGIRIKFANRSDNLIYLSGNGPISASGERTIGKVGSDLTVEQGYDAARLTAINHLSVLKKELGDLNRVVKIVKVFGMVNCDASFTDHPKVINGYSDLLIEVFGERGEHARSAVGMVSLPWNLACEIETIVEIRD